MAEVLELIRGRLHELEAVTSPMPVPRSKSNFLRVILKRLSGFGPGRTRALVDPDNSNRLSTARLVELVVQTQAARLFCPFRPSLRLLRGSVCQADGFSMRLQQALGRARAVMSP